MKKQVFNVVVMLLISIISTESFAGDYEINEFEICTASGDQARPDISRDNVVWIDHRTSDYKVHFKSLSSNEQTVISTSITHPNYGTSIDGNIITWGDNRTGVDHWYDIYGYNISTSSEFLISPQGGYRLQPDLKNNIVVWCESAPGGFDIDGYDLSTGIRFPVCTNALEQRYPATNGNIVVWQDERNGDRYDIYGYDIATQTEFPICTENDEQDFPAISENYVVWRDIRNGKYDIYGYDLNTQTELQIALGLDNQEFPAISGNIVVWHENRNGDYDIYGYDILTQTEFPIATGLGDQIFPSISGNTVVWEMNGDIYGATIPEPMTLSLLSLGGLTIFRRRRK